MSFRPFKVALQARRGARLGESGKVMNFHQNEGGAIKHCRKILKKRIILHRCVEVYRARAGRVGRGQRVAGARAGVGLGALRRGCGADGDRECEGERRRAHRERQ